jgi:hypothetical protein
MNKLLNPTTWDPIRCIDTEEATNTIDEVLSGVE